MTVEEIIAENEERVSRNDPGKYDPFAPWNPKEDIPVEEEIKRCKRKFSYWAAKYGHIKRKGGGEDITLTLNRPQQKLVDMLEDMRTKDKPIRLILLKARQWGGSTCVQLYMAWLQLVHKKGLNSLIIAHQGCATDEIKDMFDRLLRHYPDHLLYYDSEEEPGGRRMERVGGAGASWRVNPRNFKIKVGTAERPDSCRGGDYNLIHCSEVGLWKSTPSKSAEDINRAATSGVLLQPHTMILMESTANGTGNYFHREYCAAKEGISQYQALFVAWYEIDQYSLEFGSPEEKLEFARKLLERREETQAENDRSQPGRYLWQLWESGATLEAIHWYVSERSKYSDHGLMAAEYPSNDIEAFVHSGAKVFDRYCVEKLREGCGMPALRAEIFGNGEMDAESLEGIRVEERENGAFKIWKDRDSEGVYADRYLVVVDIGGRWEKADWSVIAVFDRLPMMEGRPPEIVAQWRGHIDHDILAWKAARIAKYYDNALLVIESNSLESGAMGSASDQGGFILNQIREAYPNLYARRRSEEDVRQGNPTKYGFHTNRITKGMVISTLIRAIREGEYVERDEECVNEYLTYEQKQNGSYGALEGYHDDLLMTRAIGLHVCLREMAMPARRQPERRARTGVYKARAFRP